MNKLVINGVSMDFEAQKSIKEILEILEIQSQIFAVALNSKLVKKESYEQTIPQNGDRIEFLQFMGGG